MTKRRYVQGTRFNERIRVPRIRVIGVNGEQVGIMSTKEALDMARNLELDLVEVAPNSDPPVCRIMDYGRYRYEQGKRDRSAKKKQHMVQIKEMKFRPKIDEHDFQFKVRHVKQFLESGKNVKVYVEFRGRELAHKELGARIIDRVVEELREVGAIEREPRMEGTRMAIILTPQNKK